MSLCNECPGKSSVLKWSRLSDFAKAPRRKTPLSAGLDLYSAHEVIIPQNGRAIVKTDLCIQIPHDCYGRIAARSGLSIKKYLDVGAGVIDADYTGNVGVILINQGPDDYKVKVGDSIAQLICEKISYPELLEVESLEATERGERGFGSKSLRKLEKSTKM